MRTSIKFMGKKIQNPNVRIIAVVIVVIFAIAIIMCGLVVIPIIIGIIALAFILTVPLHFILRCCGRRGLYVFDGNTHNWTLSGAFKRH